MPFVIGTDEAGYGPNLGPLCISASVWELDDTVDPDALYKLLRKVVSNCVTKAAEKRVVWADSKAIYKNDCGLDHLERGVLAALSLIDRLPADWSQLWQFLDPSCVALGPRTGTLPAVRVRNFSGLPWHTGYASRMPLWMNGPKWMTAECLEELAACLRAGLQSSGVRLVGLISRAIFPREFNELVQATNKADALSRSTLQLATQALDLCNGDDVSVFCDKHGGRNQYLPLLQQQFPDDWIEVRHEGAQSSLYRFNSFGREIEIGFYVSGERFLPVALLR